jgi:hypothetical protein
MKLAPTISIALLLLAQPVAYQPVEPVDPDCCQEKDLWHELAEAQRLEISELYAMVNTYHWLLGLYLDRVRELRIQITEHQCSADLNQDGVVDNQDHLIMLGQWTDGPAPVDPPTP